jgi:hypothetical protein
MRWIQEKIRAAEQATACAFAPQEVAEQGNIKSMRFAPRLSWIRELTQSEARRLVREIEARFVRIGELGLPAGVEDETNCLGLGSFRDCYYFTRLDRSKYLRAGFDVWEQVS